MGRIMGIEIKPKEKMTNQEQYELICEKAKKYDRLVGVLDKIRAEIKELIEWHDYDNGNDACYCEACNQAIKIIDKYKVESEEE